MQMSRGKNEKTGLCINLIPTFFFFFINSKRKKTQKFLLWKLQKNLKNNTCLTLVLFSVIQIPTRL